MARAFGPLGGGTTDSVVTGLTAHGTQRSYSAWFNRHGPGSSGGDLGRIFDKRTGADAQVEQILANDGPDVIQYDRAWTTGGTWTIARPADNVWNHVAVVYDAGSTANDPVIYLNGVSVTVTRVTAPTGSLVTNTSGYVLGNRTSDNGRNWDGYLAEFAVWNTLLSSTEVTTVYRGNTQSPLLVQTANLTAYYPLDAGLSPEPDTSGHQSSGTVTGTVKVWGPHDLLAKVVTPLPIMATGRI